MAKLLLLFSLIFCASHAYATNCALTSGANQSTISSALTAAGNSLCTGTTNVTTVALAAGTYGPITSIVTIPCNANMVGPVVTYSQTPGQTAKMQGSSSSSSWGFQTTTGCSATQTIQYIEWNGEQPTNAGGFLEVTPGTTHLVITHNWLHGVQSTDGGESQANLINFGGNSSSAITSNVTITWNIFGSTGISDCSIVMNHPTNSNGFCNGIGIGGNTADITITNNIFHWLEQGMKLYEGEGASGGCNNIIINNNSYFEISRIEFETQCNTGTPSKPTLQYIEYNNFGNRYGGMQNYDLSAANGCHTYTNCVTHSDYNFDLQANNNNPGDVGFEIWGGTINDSVGTTASYNLFQGYIYDAVTYAPAGQFVFNNNTFNIVNNGTNTDCTVGANGFWKKEDNPTDLPSCSGNTFSNAIAGTYPSASPHASPAGGTYAAGTIISITTTGTNRDANTSNWCTTDGSTPAAGSGTSTIMTSYTLPGSGSVTLRCLGMWGAANQPTSYPSGYGYVPSAVISASYTTGTSAPPKLLGVVLRSANGGATMTVGGPIMKMVAHVTYADGSSGTLPDEYGNVVTWWNSSNHRVAKISTIGHVTAVGTGSMNLEAMVGALSAKQWSVKVTAPPKPSVKHDTVAPIETKATGTGAAEGEVASIAIDPTQAVVTIGGKTQLKAIATLNDGSSKDVTDGFAWTSSDPRTIDAASSGLLSGLATGKATVTGSYQGHQASVAVASTIGDVEWSGPIVITEGGTYSGNWQSIDNTMPAITVATTVPVVIENAHIRSVAGLIKVSVAGATLTVRNSLGVALNSAAKGQPNGIFLEVGSPTRLDVENNYIENASSGVLVHGYSGDRDGKQTIVIRANRARNLTGLLSDGKGGYLPGEGANHTVSRFIELDNVQAVPGIELGWNEVINYPGHSLVSDNIDINRSSGTTNEPLEIHDTYIQGAYPYKAAQDAYTGGGIKTEGSSDSPQDAAAFNNIHDNQVIGTVGYGIEFTAGHDSIASNNRVISSGLLADGARIAAQHVGMANGDVNVAGVGNGSMYNNTMRDNLIGWACWSYSCSQTGYRKDEVFAASPSDYSTNSVLAAQPITAAMENNEYQLWLDKIASDGIAVGPSF